MSIRVETRSGKALDVRADHTVYEPVGPYADGDEIDPATVRVLPERAGRALRRGARIVVDNRVETVSAASADR